MRRLTGKQRDFHQTVEAAQRILAVGIHVAAAVPAIASDCIRLRGKGHAEPRQVALARRAAQTAWALGPMYVKLAQSFSSRMDVLPPAVCETLRANTVDVRGGDNYRGSIATVERTQRDGRTVAVKRIDPRAARLLAVDARILRRVAVLARSRLMRADYAADLLEEFTDSISAQSNLHREAQALERFADLEDSMANIEFPKPLAVEDAGQTLVMTWLPGQDDQPTESQSPASAKRLMRLVFEMLFVHGFIHCDLHAGNWWTQQGGALAVVDAGFCYEIDDALQASFGEFFLGLSAGNGEMCADHAVAVCRRKLTAEEESGFRVGIQDLVGRTSGQTAEEFSLAGFARDLFGLQRRYGAHAKAEFIFPFVALLAVEGQVKQLDPKLNFQSIAGPIVLRGLLANERRRSQGAS